MFCCMGNFFLEHLLLTALLIGIFSAISVLWLYTYITCGICKTKARMDRKTVIITGCCSGIGKETASDLAKRGARVIMACRNLDKAHTVRDSIIKATGNSSVIVKYLDVSLLKSVRLFAEEINRSEKRLDVLILNAGISLGGKHITEEGLQLVWATNHFGHFLLTHLLIDLLKKTEKSRIVVVSSVSHSMRDVIDVNNLNPVEETSQDKLYCDTKFANVLFANELSRRLKGSGTTANSLHPGGVYTSIWDENPFWVHIALQFCRPFFKSAEQGAQTQIYLAVSEEVEGVSGKYFVDCKVRNQRNETMDEGLAKKFWEASEEIAQLKPSDPHI